MCKAIQADKPSYKLGHDGSDGLCDCIGLIIGAIRRSGGRWTGTHGSNYAARYEMREFVSINSVGQLQPGWVVYKRWKPGDAKYDLPAGYKSGSDQGDYYHVGVVISVAPLVIMHCTSWTSGGAKYSGIKIDESLGNWKWGGRLKKVQYEGTEVIIEMPVICQATVKTSGGILNLRDAPNGKDIGDIPNGAKVDVLEKTSAAWWKVTYKGAVGWVSVTYLVEVGASAPESVAVVLPRSTWEEVRDAINAVLK